MRHALLFGAVLTLGVAGGATLAPQLASPAAFSAGAATASTTPGVLLVCNGSTAKCPALPHGSKPYYRTVQSAVNAAKAGDWILIYPGVYHEKSTEWPTAGVWIQTPDLHIRGLNRNTVIIDGSNGTAAHPCPSAAAQQSFAPRNGIEVYKTSGVTIQNLTVCDYLAGGNEADGNEIWWNGGAGSGKIGFGAYSGSYLTATSEYAGPVNSTELSQYGIFANNSDGPGVISNSYASNMADAAYYVGACQRVCGSTLVDDTGVNSQLGYSGTNSGGTITIKDSVFELNRAGIVPNSENNADAPSPQDGRCPNSATKSCMMIEDNLIENNNNANAPGNGFAPPVGVGIQIAGGEYDTMTGNTIEDQGSWGILTSDYPDNETPPPVAHCAGGFPNDPGPGICLYKARGNLIYGNTFIDVGTFGNPTNSDMAIEVLSSNTPRNCFYGNVSRTGPLTSEPANIESASVDGKPCTKAGTGADLGLAAQLLCATYPDQCMVLFPVPLYPVQTKTSMLPLPKLTTMPDPCGGVPENAFCP